MSLDKIVLTFGGSREMTVSPTGDVEYYEDGVLHRDDGPAVVRVDGKVVYYYRGCKQRDEEYGPTSFHPKGTMKYYFMGDLHRDEGPAVIRADGTVEYWKRGIRVTESGSDWED